MRYHGAVYDSPEAGRRDTPLEIVAATTQTNHNRLIAIYAIDIVAGKARGESAVTMNYT